MVEQKKREVKVLHDRMKEDYKAKAIAIVEAIPAD
jgi:hypothetical protein